nr:MAG TPA: hypothetical protein [Caudoviricetes sp.]
MEIFFYILNLSSFGYRNSQISKKKIFFQNWVPPR